MIAGQARHPQISDQTAPDAPKSPPNDEESRKSRPLYRELRNTALHTDPLPNHHHRPTRQVARPRLQPMAHSVLPPDRRPL